MTKAQKACWRKTLGVEESNVTFLFLGKKTSWSLFFPSPFHLVGIHPGARMQTSSPSVPTMRFLETLKSFTQVNGSASGEWKCGAGWRRKASFKTTMGSQGWCNLGGWAIFLPMLPSNAAVVPPCQGSTSPCKPKPWPQGQMWHHWGQIMLPPPLCFPSKCYSGNGEFIPLHPLFCFGFFLTLNPGYKLLTRCGGGDSQKLTL